MKIELVKVGRCIKCGLEVRASDSEKPPFRHADCDMARAEEEANLKDYEY